MVNGLNSFSREELEHIYQALILEIGYKWATYDTMVDKRLISQQTKMEEIDRLMSTDNPTIKLMNKVKGMLND